MFGKALIHLKFKITVKIKSKTWISCNYSSDFHLVFLCQTQKVDSLKSVQRFLENPLMCAHLGNVHFWCNYWLILKLVQIIPSPADADKPALSILKIAFSQPLSRRQHRSRWRDWHNSFICNFLTHDFCENWILLNTQRSVSSNKICRL